MEEGGGGGKRDVMEIRLSRTLKISCTVDESQL